MPTKATHLVSTLLLLTLLLVSPTKTVSNDLDSPPCPYPCNPPPTSVTNCPPPPPSTPFPPSEPSGGYPPPPPWTPGFGNYPPPSGNFPYYPPPSSSFATPPPPNPIMPYFPWYYKTPPSAAPPANALVHVAFWVSIVMSLGFLLW